jgi:ABC-type nickel/cobalt efflux system permease component RcnA
LLLGVLLLLPTLVIFGLGFTVNALLLAVGVTLAVWAVAMAMRAPRNGRRRSARGHGRAARRVPAD